MAPDEGYEWVEEQPGAPFAGARATATAKPRIRAKRGTVRGAMEAQLRAVGTSLNWLARRAPVTGPIAQAMLPESPFGTDPELPPPFGTKKISAVQRATEPLAAFRGLQVIPSAIAGRIATGRWDPLGEFTKLVYPEKYGEGHTLAGVAGHAAEARTGSKLIGQAAAVGGFAGDVILGLDVLAGHAVSFGGVVSRRAAIGATERAVAKAAAAAVAEGVVEGSVARTVAKAVAADTREAIRGGARTLTHSGRYAFEPQDLAAGLEEPVAHFKQVAHAAIRRVAPDLDPVVHGDLTARVVGSLQHEFTEGFRARVPLPGFRKVRFGKRPTAPLMDKALEADIARGARTAEQSGAFLGEVRPDTSPEGLAGRAEAHRTTLLEGMRQVRTTKADEVAVHRAELRRLAGASTPTHTETVRQGLVDNLAAARNREHLAGLNVQRAETSGIAHTEAQLKTLADEYGAAQAERQAVELHIAAGGEKLPDYLRLPVPDRAAPIEVHRAQGTAAERAWQRIRPAVEELYTEKRSAALAEVGSIRESAYTAASKRVDPDVQVLGELLHGKNRRLPPTAQARQINAAERARSPITELQGKTWAQYAKETSWVSAKRMAANKAATGKPELVKAVLIHSSPTMTDAKIDTLIANLAAGRMGWVQEFYRVNKVPDWAQEIFHERLGEISHGVVSVDYAANPAGSAVRLAEAGDSTIGVNTWDVLDDVELDSARFVDEKAAAQGPEMVEQALDAVKGDISDTLQARGEVLEEFDKWAATARETPEALAQQRQALADQFERDLSRLQARQGEIHAAGREAEVATRTGKPSGRPAQAAITPRQAYHHAANYSEKVQVGYRMLRKAALEDPRWRNKLVGPLAQREQAALESLVTRAKQPAVSPASTERIARAKDRLRVRQAQTRRAAGELAAAGPGTPPAVSPEFAAIEQGVLRRLPRSLNSTVDAFMEELRARGVPVSPRVEGRLRSIAIRQAEREIERLTERMDFVEKQPIADLIARRITESERAGVKQRLEATAAGAWQKTRQFVSEGTRIPKTMNQELRSMRGRAFGDMHRREVFTNRIYEGRGITPAEREAITIARDVYYPHYLKKAIGETPAGTEIPGLPADTVTYLLRKIAPEIAEDGWSYLDDAGEVMVKKLPPRVRKAWEAMIESSELRHEQWNGSPRLARMGFRPGKQVANELIDLANPNMPIEERELLHLGDLGPGYAMQAHLHNAPISEVRRILEGTQPDIARLYGAQLAKAEIDPAEHARVLDRYFDDIVNGRPVAAEEVPHLDAAELDHAGNLHARRNEQLLDIYKLVKKTIVPNNRLPAGEVARRTAAGWKSLEWSPGQPVKGLEEYLVPPGFQAEIIADNPAWEGILGTKFMQGVGKFKPLVLFSGVFAGAQIMEQFSNLARALPYMNAKGVLRGWRYTMGVIAREATESFSIVPPKGASDTVAAATARAVAWADELLPRKLDELLSVVAPHATPKRLAQYREIATRNLKLLHEYPVNTGIARQATSEVYKTWDKVTRKYMGQASTLGVGRRAGRELVGKAVTGWFAADTLGRTALEIGLVESGESPAMARQLVRTVSVEYAPEMQAPLDHMLQQTFWFIRYSRHRIEQFAHEAVRNPGLVATYASAARNWPKLSGVDEETNTILLGRPGWLRSSVEYWPMTFSLPWTEPFDPDKFPAVQAVDGQYIMYERIRDPVLEGGSDILDWMRPVEAFIGRLPPPARSLVAWNERGLRAGAEGLPVVGLAMQARRKLGPPPPDKPSPTTGAPSVRPPAEEGIAAAARAPKQLWKDNPELARQYEQEKTLMLRQLRFFKQRGIAMYPVFFNDCVKNLTPAQLEKLAQYHKVPGHGYVPLEMKTMDELGNVTKAEVSIEGEMRRRAAGRGPTNAWEQMNRRW